MRTYLARDLDGSFHHDFVGGSRCFLDHDDCAVLQSRVHFVVPAKGRPSAQHPTKGTDISLMV